MIAHTTMNGNIQAEIMENKLTLGVKFSKTITSIILIFSSYY